MLRLFDIDMQMMMPMLAFASARAFTDAGDDMSPLRAIIMTISSHDAVSALQRAREKRGDT